MYITLQSIKRNLGLFNLEFEDLIIGSSFLLLFTILFLLQCYTTAIVILLLGVLGLIPNLYLKIKIIIYIRIKGVIKLNVKKIKRINTKAKEK